MARRSGLTALLIFAAASFAAVAIGALILALSGLSPAVWLRNPGAWLVGLLAGAGLMAGGQRPMVARAAMMMALAGLAATFLAPAQQGVHRWIGVGPLHVNAAALLLPPAIVAIGLRGVRTWAGLAFSAAVAILLLLQPDASQATAFAVAFVILMLGSPGSRLHGYLAVVAAALAAGAAWLRPDPLEPVPEVEGIFALGFTISPLLGVAAAVALAGASLAPLALRGAGERRDAARALSGYLAIAALMPFAGAYPVPLVGLGMSFPVGGWLAMAMLSAGKTPEAASVVGQAPRLCPRSEHRRGACAT